MRFRFSRQAESDIEAIGDFIAHNNPTRALSFISELRAYCRSIADFPRAYPVRAEFGRGMRLAVFGNYFVVNVVRRHLVEIRRLIHAARER